jgi:hypothetical protein
MTAAKGGSGLGKLFEHFFHFAAGQEVVLFDGSFAGNIGQGALFPVFGVPQVVSGGEFE